VTLRLHLQIIGALLLILSAAHAFFPRYFRWKEELARLSTFTRQVFLVHCFFIALALALLGAASLVYPDALLEPPALSRILLPGIVLFWACRLVVQFAVYDSSIWRGRGFYTAMHIVFSAFWIYVAAAYGLAMRRVWAGS
jgi:hypothetical protein